MSNISISEVIARYQSGFGYVAGNIASIAGNRIWSNLIDISTYPVSSANFANVLFTHQKTNKSFGFGIEGSLKEIGNSTSFNYMGPALMISTSRDKIVVETPIDRSEIEVIENFGLKPFEITIQGILIDTENHQYPKALVRLINEIFTLPGTFKIEGEIFADLGITEVFFRSGFEIGFVEGFADTVKFSVNVKSTLPAELQAVGY
jgi:hypothetical protein